MLNARRHLDDDRVDLRQIKTGSEAREWYHQQLADFAALDGAWQTQGVPLAERARRAFEMRRNARLGAREQMDPRAVVALETRDIGVYGDPDGPTFDKLVETLTRKGKTLEQAYEAIVDSARRSDAGYDARAKAQKDQPR